MRHWPKVVMRWECGVSGLVTNVPVDDWPEDAMTRPPKSGYFHTIHDIVATALPDRRWELQAFVRRVSIGPTTQREKIGRELRTAAKIADQQLQSLDQGEYSAPYLMVFSLRNKEQFCQTALNVVRSIFSRFEIDDEKQYRIADFTVETEEHYVWVDSSWMPFERWLRVMNNLPDHTCADIGRGHLKPILGPQ